MIAAWPHGICQFADRNRSRGGMQSNRVVFEADHGAPIERPRGTASLELVEIALPPMPAAQMALFSAWFDGDLAFGTQPFVWWHPVGGALRKWRFAPGDQPWTWAETTKGLVQIAFSALILPDPLWFAPYVRPGEIRVPYAVADYAGGVFGVDGSLATGADVALVSGTYDVWTLPSAGPETLQAGLAVSAGDIPATAPPGVARILAFLP